MYDELVWQLRKRAEVFDYYGWVATASDYKEAANAIEELSRLLDGVKADNDSLCAKIEKMCNEPHWISAKEPYIWMANGGPLQWLGQDATQYGGIARAAEGGNMNELKINLNEVVKVKLTGLGKDIYYHQFDELNRRYGRVVCKPSFPEEDAEGYTKFQLWNFIEIYGEHVGMTKLNVIEPLEIVYELPGEE